MLVGREGELGKLQGLIAAGRPIVVVGEAGVGKTSLVRRAIAESGRRMLEGGALSTLGWMPYLPIQRVMGRQLPPGDDVFLAAEVKRVVGDGILFLDDIHWADSQTRALLTLLTGRVSVVAAVRRGDQAAGGVLRELGQQGFDRMDIEPLDDRQAWQLLHSLRADLPARVASRIVGQAGGNPLLLEELAAHGAPTDSLRLALSARLRHLSAAARRAMGLLALAGHPLPAAALGDGAGELLQSGLATESDGGLTFRHALLAEILVSEFGEAERRDLHATLAKTLESPGEAARHHAAAGERELARAAALRAAEATPYAGERARHLELAANCSDGPAADELRLSAARELVEANDYRGVAALLDQIKSDNRLVQGEVSLLHYFVLEVAVDYPAARAAWRRGVDLVAGSRSDIETRLQIEAGRIAYLLDHDPRAIEIAEAGYALARRRGSHRTMAQFILGSAQLIGRDSRWRRSLEQAVAAARRTAEVSLEYRTTNNLVWGLVLYGELDRAREVAVEAEARARARHLGGWERRMAAWLVGIDWHQGALARAVERGEPLLEDGSEITDRRHAMLYLGHALIDLGRHAAARQLVDALLAETAPGGNIPQGADLEEVAGAYTMLAQAELSAGRARAALAAAESASRSYGTIPPSDTLFMAPMVESWARLELDLPQESRSIGTAPIAQGLPVEIEGVQLLSVGQPRAASRRFKEAAALWQHRSFGSFLRCRWAEGEALRRAGETSQAISALEDAEQLARSHGYARIVARVERSLRLCGVRRAARRGTDGVLTTRESEVLALVSDGFSNAEIARRLGLSTSTVKRTIETAARKLGASSRLQAAAQVPRG